MEHVLQAHHRGFGVAPGGRHRQPAAPGRKHFVQRLRPGAKALHHLLLPEPAELFVKGRGRQGEIMGKIAPSKQRRVAGAGLPQGRALRDIRHFLLIQ